MNIDTIRGLTAYVVAGFVVVVGMASLIVLTAIGTVDLPAVVAIISGAAGFLFGAEVSKQASKQSRSDLLQPPPADPPANP